MVRYLIILIISFIARHECFAQTQPNSTFIGHVIGVPKDSFENSNNNINPELKLQPLEMSLYPIELRLYETDFPIGWTYCTIIYFDSTFKRKCVRRRSIFADDTAQVENVGFSKKIKVDSLFNILINNGIFSLQDQSLEPYTLGKYPKNYIPVELKRNGHLEKINPIKVSDGVYYVLEFKVGNLFNSFSTFNNPKAFSKYYRDNQTLKRQSEITEAIVSGRN